VIQQKVDNLRSILQDLGSAAIAFSGGTDSTFLLYQAFSELGPDNCLAVCANSVVFTSRELERAESFCVDRGIPLQIIEHDVLAIDGFRENSAERCYLCKKSLLEQISVVATQYGLNQVLEGSVLDDLEDYRPGRRALAECNVRSPLLEAGLSKAEVWELSQEMGLVLAEQRPESCLATRFMSGQTLTPDGLRRVELAEQALHDLGFQLLRVRVHGTLARLECDGIGMGLLSDSSLRQTVHDLLVDLGFRQVAVDLAGYQRGSMNARVT
jgi:uncharacterized protein